MPEIVWLASAEQDLLAVFAELEKRRDGLGAELVACVDAVLDHVRRHPELAPVYEPPIRRLVIATTGYGLFYSIQSRGIMVHAVAAALRQFAIGLGAYSGWSRTNN